MKNTRLHAAKLPNSFSFEGNKAQMLEWLEPRLTSARVPPQVSFTVEEWKGSSEKVLTRIHQTGWSHEPLAVRSSMSLEDGFQQSMAGHYRSEINVIGPVNLTRAIEAVIESYGKCSSAEAVLVQPMVTDVVLSGVCFGVDPNTGGPYYVLNYDDESGSTSSVTSGATNRLKTYYCFYGREAKPSLSSLIRVMEELTDLLGTRKIDVEFAIDVRGTVYVLQCRPLVTTASPEIEAEVLERLCEVEDRVKNLSRPHPYLLGDKALFGVMPDWNPAEIIGIRPRPLALTLYKELITDSIWAYQRDNYGYRNLRSFPLLITLAGVPYIDVRVSFNSFIPADLSSALGRKLVNHYLDRLVACPNYHDKVEFEIVYTCYTLDLDQRLSALRDSGFSSEECETLKTSLRRLTNRIVHGESGLWRTDIEKIDILTSRLDTIKRADLDPLAKIYWLLEDCKRYGTLPFAGLARAGFIAIQMLRSLVNVGIMTHGEYDRFLGSLNTVSSQLTHDFQSLSRKEFLDKYGHLRPGTYDILSPRYDEEPDRYFEWASRPKPRQRHEPFVLSLPQLRAIEKLLRRQQLDHDVLGFFEFMKSAIEGREYAKFIFTRSLSDALLLIKSLGGEMRLSVEDCAFLHINVLRDLYSSSFDRQKAIRESIKRGREEYEITQHISLPPLLIRPEEVYAFELLCNSPNFITQKSIIAKTGFPLRNEDRIENTIVFIPNADPGFDWIFSKGIKGLITMYGGVNSHMAIRAGELGIPAVIGAGENLYREWSKAATLQIDCNSRQVRILR